MGEDAAAAAAEESKKTVYVAPSDGGAPGLVKTSLQFQSHKKRKPSFSLQGYISTCAALLAFCLLFDFPGGDRQRGAAAAAAWAVGAAAIAAKKLSLSPASTYALAVECVVLSTLAIGSFVSSFPAFVVASTVAAAAQAFLSLPMKIRT